MILNLKVIWLDFIILDVVVMNRSSYLAIEEPQSHFQWTAKLITDGGLVPILTPSQHHTQDSIPSQITMQHVDALQNRTQSCVLLHLVRRNHQLPPHPSSLSLSTWRLVCAHSHLATQLHVIRHSLLYHTLGPAHSLTTSSSIAPEYQYRQHSNIYLWSICISVRASEDCRVLSWVTGSCVVFLNIFFWTVF